MNKKKLLALLMALVMTLTLVPVTALAEGTATVTGNSVAKVTVGETETYYESLQEALNNASTAGEDATVDVLKDIDLQQAPWAPVYLNGYTGAAKNVVVQGNGYSISGLSAPLFLGTWSNTTIKIYNLTVKDSTIAGVDSSGCGGTVSSAFIGCVSASRGTLLDHCTVSNCTFTGGKYSGAFVGYAAGYGKQNDGPVFSDITISNCTATGNTITGTGSSGALMGHATGDAWTYVIITGATATGNRITGAEASKTGILVGTLGVGQTHLGRDGGLWIEATESGNILTVGQYEIGRIGSDGGMGFFTQGGSYTVNPLLTSDSVGTITAEEGYTAVQSGDTWTIAVPAASTPVAQIGTTNYATLAEAFAAAQDGDTITLLADCSGNGISVPQGKFGTDGLTVDFADFTYTVDQEPLAGSTGTKTQAFQLLKDNKITFKNGTIYSEVAKMLVQNYSNLTLDGMTLTLDNPNYAYAYTLSNNNGNVVIDDTTINANPAGRFAFDVCRYSSYPSVSVTVEGDSTINGDIEFDAVNGNPIDGIHLTLVGGTHNGDIKLTTGGKNALNAGVNDSITKASTFTQAAPEGYTWSAADTNGIQTLVKLPDVAQIGTTKYTTLEAAVAAAQTGDTINIIADFAIPETNTAESDRIIVNKSVTIDFGEYTMSVPGALGDDDSNNWVGLYIQGSDVNVTLTGTTGGIDCLNYNDGAGAYSFYAKDGATVTVNGGHYHGGGTVGQVAAGTLIINDGYFKVTDFGGNYSGYRYVLNCVDAYYTNGTATITVKGGTFEHFDPSNCLAEGANTNFVADGYEAVALTGENEGKWQVGKVKATGLTLDTTAQNDNTTATYTATKSVVDEQTNANLLEKPETSFSVTVTAPTENLGSGKESIQLSNININEVVAAAVDKADEQSETSASVTVQLAKDESAQVVAVTETTKKVTFEVHPEAIITVTKTDEDDVVTTLPLSNDQIKGAFSFKLTIPTDLATVGEKVTVIHKHSDNTEENLGAFTVADDHTITLTGISSFSEFIATSVSEGDVTVGAVGASLRRRVLTSDHTTVVNTSTDYRVTFDWTDTESKVNVSESYLEWSNNDGATWHEVSIANSAALDGGVTRASVVITGIPRAAFGTTIKTRIHLATSGEAIVAYGPDYSVNVVADKLSKLTGNETWSEYGRYLLGTRTEPLYVNN